MLRRGSRSGGSRTLCVSPRSTSILTIRRRFTAGKWTAHELSGPDGIKYDLIGIVDLDADGHADVITTEEQLDTKGLGVIWYENPGR